MIKVAFSFKSQGNQKTGLFFQGTKVRQNLSYESLTVVNLKYIKIFSLAVLNDCGD